eukprot:Nk52_evm10s376 gene=Nk52_evmTU10s376
MTAESILPMLVGHPIYHAFRQYAVPLFEYRLFPELLVFHALNTALANRASSKNLLKFNCEYPLAGFVHNTSIVFGSLLMLDFFLGNRCNVLNDFGLHIIGISTWYAVYFSPFDIVWEVSNWKPVKFALAVLWELRRVRLISIAVEMAASKFDSQLGLIVCGFIFSGFGGALIRDLGGVVLGNPVTHQLKNLSGHFRLAFFTAVVMSGCELGTAPILKDEAIALFTIMFCVYSGSIVLIGPYDPCKPLVDVFCAFAFDPWSYTEPKISKKSSQKKYETAGTRKSPRSKRKTD